MIDKVGIKTTPKTTISMRIDITPTDILPLLQMALTGEESTKNDTQPLQKNHTRRITNKIYKK